MNHDHTTGHAEAANASGGSRKLIGAVIMLALIGAFFLLREHWPHIAGYCCYVLCLSCLLMHLMHGRGWHGSHEVDSSKK